MTKGIGASDMQQKKASQIPWKTLRAVLFDWAGTTIDHGSLAPVEVVRRVFSEIGLDITEAEARQPMGKAKIDHLREVLAMPRVLQQWTQIHAQPPKEEDILSIYKRFLSVQSTVLADYANLIPGVLELAAFLRNKGVKIGSTTGYTRELMNVLLPLSASAGYEPDTTICSDEVAAGRPAPWSNFRAAEMLGVYPMQSIIVVDDSVAGVQAGKNAGCYAVAVTVTGNALGKSEEALARMDQSDVLKLHQQAEHEFYAKGADLVVDSVSTMHHIWKQHAS